MGFGLAVFYDTHTAMLASRALEAELSVQVIPTPRAISAACGISVRFNKDDIQQVFQLLQSLLASSEFTLYQTDDGHIFSQN